GILIRDIDALQKAEKIDTVVLDKTGTVTRGMPSIKQVETYNGIEENELLRLLASAEQYSSHPVAKAIVSLARERGLTLNEPVSLENYPGFGLVSEIEGKKLLIGSPDILLLKRGASNSTRREPVSSKLHVTPEAVEKILNDIKIARSSQAMMAGTFVG